MTHAYVRTLVHNCINGQKESTYMCATLSMQISCYCTLAWYVPHTTTRLLCEPKLPAVHSCRNGSHPHKSIRTLQTESPRSINDLRSIWFWSDKVQPYMYHKVLKHFESHYSVWNKELCTSALRLKFLPLSRLKYVSKLFSLSRFHSILYHCNIPSCNKLTVTIATYIRTYVHTCNTSSGS